MHTSIEFVTSSITLPQNNQQHKTTMKKIHDILLLTAATIASFFRAPDGAESGGSVEKTTQDYAKENADLSARAQELGIEVPAFPADPAGLSRCREFLKKAIEEKEAGGDGETPVEATDPQEFADSMDKSELLAIVEEEGVEDVDEHNNKLDIAKAILKKRSEA